MLKKLFYAALIALGIVGIAASIIAPFVSTSIGIGTVFPGIAGIVFIAYAIAHILRPGHIIKIKWLRIVIIVLVCIGVFSFVAVEALIIGFAGSCPPQGKVSFVIVPGAGIFPDGRLTLTLKYRLDKAYDYLVENEETICVVSGGQGDNEPRTEAEAMRDYLVSKGIDESRIVAETRSRDTKENMEFTAELLSERYPYEDMTAVVITSSYHVFRAVTLARDNDFEAYGIPAASPWSVMINNYMREYIGFFKLILLDLR